MGLLDNYKTKKAITTILDEGSLNTPKGKQAAATLKQIGSAAIPKLIESLASRQHTALIKNILINMVENTNLPIFITGMKHSDKSIATGVSRVLAQSTRFDPNRLLDLLLDPAISVTHLAPIFNTHIERLNCKSLLNLLTNLGENSQTLANQLLPKICNEQHLEEILYISRHEDAELRALAAPMLVINQTKAITRLSELLSDSARNVRLNALNAYAKLTIPVSAEPVCQLLRDPDMTVQSKAIDTIVKLNDRKIVQYLIDILQDESEYIRRAAVEVLNIVGDEHAVRDLLNALKDKDWWVKVRAADALSAIGGPRVMDAVFALIKDEDEFLRRTAVEILNSRKDERALDHLIEALRDADWWVRERAADALGALGDARATEPLCELLGDNTQASLVAVKALATIGDRRAVNPLVRLLDTENSNLRKEVLRSLEILTDLEHAEQVQTAITPLIELPDIELRELAEDTLNTIIAKFGDHTTLIKRSGNAATVTTPPSNPIEINHNSTANQHIDYEKIQTGIILGSRYEIMRKIGQGGFGVVYLVVDRVVDDEIILKFLNPQIASDHNMIQRFIHELRFTRKITHENVIRIYDFITFENANAISMEYFPSHSLADELKPKQPLDRERSIKICMDICKGMSAAQQADVIHRDLKPANILINDDDLVKIVDFGIAAAAAQGDTRLTKSGIMVGTPKYMAPEQIRGGEIDARADIYTLGIVMYEMFTGNPPYEGGDAMATLFQHVEGNAKPPSEMNPQVDKALEEVILKAIAVDPQNRFQTFEQFRDSLAQLL